MPSTSWTALDAEDLTVGLTATDQHFDGPIQLQPQWIDDGGPFPVEGPIITDSTALEDIHTTTSDELGPDSAIGGWALAYDNNYDVRWHSAWSQNFKTSGRLVVAGYGVIDPDADQWRTDKAEEIRSAWVAAHPTHFGVTVEWEGWDFGLIFGSHSDRRLGITTLVTDRASTLYTQFDFPGGSINPQPSSEPVVPPSNIPATNVVVPAGQSTDPGTYNGSDATALESVSLGEQRWALDDVTTAGSLLGEVGAEAGTDGPTLQASEVVVADGDFDAVAVPLTHFDETWRVTRGMVVWMVPDVDALWQERMQSAFQVEGSVVLTTLFQPPRYRITYGVDTIPIQQTFARDDELAGGAFQNWPPPKSEQRSNVTFGNYR